jgi:hypothetical protein
VASADQAVDASARYVARSRFDACDLVAPSAAVPNGGDGKSLSPG